jgi:Zn-dependent protease with chaperone function
VTDVHSDGRKPRLNPFVFPSDTDFRLILLIVSVISASLFIYAYLYPYFPANLQYSHNTSIQCQKEADAAHPGNSLTAKVARLNDFQQCNAATLGRAQFIWTIGDTLLLIILAGIICWALPFWKIWRNRLVPLKEEDVPEVVSYLKDLCQEAELPRFPKFLWNPLKLAKGGLAFGSFGRSYVALDGGLVQQFYTDQPAFRAVVLHELAHLRNADIGKTYFTVAIGWAFLVAALIPLLVILISFSWSHGWDVLSYFDIGWRILALAVLVYLTRSAVLRAREAYADLRASVWDGQNGALDRVLDTLPRPKAGRWRNPLNFHPHPDERRQILNDTFGLFHMGFWEAFATGIAFTITVLNVGYMLGLLNFVGAEIVVPGLIIALPVIGVVALGIWRSTFAQLVQGKAPSSVWQLGLGMGLGLLAGQSLSLVGYLMQAGYFSNLFIPAFSQSNLPSLTVQLSLGILESLPLLVVLLFFFKWIVTSASVWLTVASTRSSPRFIFWTGLLISGLLLGALFGLLYEAYLTSNFGSIINVIVYLLLFLIYVLLQPLTLIVSIGLWAYPLAAWLWHKRVITTTGTNWMFLDSLVQQQVSLPQPQLRPGLALIAGLVSGIIGCVLLAILAIGIRLNFMLYNYSQETLSILIQGCVAAVVAGKVEQLRWIHGLFAAFVAGCIMAVGTMGIRWVLGEIIDFNLTWTWAINVGALVALGASALAGRIRRSRQHPVSMSAS